MSDHNQMIIVLFLSMLKITKTIQAFLIVVVFIVLDNRLQQPHCLIVAMQETYGEDPYLTGVYASNYIRGLQGNNSRYVRASGGCKHFDAHCGPENIPVSRFSFDAQVSILMLVAVRRT